MGLFHLTVVIGFVLGGVVTIAEDVTFIDDVYSFNNIYIAWTSESRPQSLQYRKYGESMVSTVSIKNVSERYNRSEPVYASSLINLEEDTVYEFQMESDDITTSSTLPATTTVYRVKTISSSPTKTDWKFYVEKTTPYVAGAVGAVVLTEFALDILGFEASYVNSHEHAKRKCSYSDSI